MRTTLTPRLNNLALTKSIAIPILLFLFLTPSYIFGQCPPEVLNFPVDLTINNNDECMATVTWVEPTYSMDCDDFDESFVPGNWASNTNGQDGSVNTTFAPATIALTGSTNGTPATNTDTDYCITIPFDGRINFDWTATAIGGGAQLINDEPAYTLDGVETILNITGTPAGSGVSTESGNVMDLDVTAGQVFCFRAKSNNLGATTTVDISNFSFEITQIVQTNGVALNSVQGIGDYIIEYTVPNCDGTTSSCDFTVSVREGIDPVITCPADITMDVDPFRCTAVVCFNVDVADNCPAVLPDDIPDYTFLGSFDGHNYFVSDPGNTLLWEEANEAASALGGHLVVVTSDMEQDFLIDNIPLGTYWIGLRYSPSLEEFKWVNGEPFVYEDWGPGQPGGLLDGDYVFNWDFFGGFLDGWYDTPSLLPIRYIVEIETYSTELIEGLPAGSNFPVGITEVNYVVTDASGNTNECSFNVTVRDTQDPIIECPANEIIQLMPEQCDTLLTFDDPLFSDNCPDAVITQIEGLPSGSSFPIGENIISFEARDTSGNVDTCTWSITVNDYIPMGMVCNGEINFSLDDATCSGELTPSMLIDVTSVGCADSCTISIIENGIRRPAIFTSDDIGKSYDYEICCGGICCWGIVNVEFKLPPVILCIPNDTLSCTQAFDESVLTPDVGMSCADVELILLDEIIETLSCDTMFTAKMTRIYTAIDEYGNTSDTCTQMVFMERTNLDSISSVQPFALFNNNSLNCSSGFATTSQGYPFPALSVTGAPQLRLENGDFIDLFPFQANVICNGFAEFSDEILPGSTSCVIKIMRTFTIGEWWCSQTNEREFVQLIEVVDFEGPSVSCPSDITISTTSFSCEGYTSVALPNVNDACNGDEIRIDLSTSTGFMKNYMGETFMLPVGENELTYHIYDDCDNRTDCSFTVTVRDEADPIAICDQFTTVGIGLETLTIVTAESIDDGSFDECGEVSLAVARMDAPGFEDLDGFGPDISITCEDAGTNIMVGLLVTDAGGNTNMCMVSVEVQDKIDAQFLCPGDMEVECNFPYDPSNLSAFFGEVTIYDNCPSSNKLRDTIIGSLNSCGAGVLTREITLYSAQGEQIDFCTQEITFAKGTTLQFSDITPPISEVTVTGCGVESIDPSILGMPIVPDNECQQTAIAITNDTFPFTSNGACLKIIRTFRVIDWCIDDGPGSILEPFEFIQTIKVNNTEGPEPEEIFADSVFCSYEVECGSITIDGYLTATFIDDCTETSDLLNRYEVRDSEGILVQYGAGLDASGTYDVDEYTVRFISEDKCGNQTFEESTFEVRSCKLPTPYCLQGLSTTLTAMDTTGDGTADVEMVMLHADFFDAGSYHPCGYEVEVSFSSDVTDTLVSFFCSDTLGLQPIELWVTDENGGQDYCTTFIDVQNNDTIDLCGSLKPVDIAGRIYTESDAELQKAEVELRSTESLIRITDENGIYEFNGMPIGGDYQVLPYKDNDYLNGVSTLDLVLIQRHVLGISTLNSVYKIIAGDINNDEKISASDLLGLRKVILGIDKNFPNNTSWRFIATEHEFANEENPWETHIKESQDILSLSEDVQIDFIAVKTGDVNGNVDMNIAEGMYSETRSNRALILKLPEIEIERNKIYHIDVKGVEAMRIFGLQQTMWTEGIEILDILPGELELDAGNISVRKEMFHMSYASTGVDVIEKDKLLYTLVIKANENGLLSEKIGMSDKGLKGEVYLDKGLEIGNLSVEWKEVPYAAAKEELILIGNNPNPWRNSTEIIFRMPKRGTASVKVTDIRGKLLVSRKGEYEAGMQKIKLTESDIQQAGILLYEIRIDDQIANGRMIRIR